MRKYEDISFLSPPTTHVSPEMTGVLYIFTPPDSMTQMWQDQAIRYLKAIDDTDPTTLIIGTAIHLWGCEILCNLQQQ